MIDIVRAATLGSYGVVGLTGGGPAGWLAERRPAAARSVGRPTDSRSAA